MTMETTPTTIPVTMRAVVLTGVTRGEDVQISEVPVPAVKPGWVLVRVKAFGINHSEQILRLEEINEDYIKKPVIPGIECVGEIADPGDSGWETGQRVVALMGGMGRTFDGGYAQYALLPAGHVFPVESDLDWTHLAAVPETYFTAWGSLFGCLHLQPSDTLLVRGATCALGYAAIQIAHALGARVIATTHRESKRALLEGTGADEIIVNDGRTTLAGQVHGVTRALELVGPLSVLDTLKTVETGGIVCDTGVLGGPEVLDGFDPIKDIPNGKYLTGFFSNYPTQKVMDDIFAFLNAHHLTPLVGAAYDFDELPQVLAAMDAGEKVNGKVVIRI